MMNYLSLFENNICTLVYDARPVLFISELQGTKYICGIYSTTEKIEEWLIAEITDNTCRALQTGCIDSYDCFNHAIDGDIQILQVDLSPTDVSDDLTNK